MVGSARTGILRHTQISWSALTSEAALLAVSLTAGIGVLRLTTTPGAPRLVWEVVATVVSGHLATWFIERAWTRTVFRRGAQIAAFDGGVLAVAVVTMWVTVPSATRFGLPTLTTLRTLYDRFGAAGSVITARPTPLPPTPGVVLCFVAGAGLAAVVGRALWGWASRRSRRSISAAVALVPSMGLFIYGALLSSGKDRAPAAFAYIAAVILFLLVSDRASTTSSARTTTAWTTPRKKIVRRPARGALTTGLVSGTLAVAILLGLAPALSGMKLSALPFSSGKQTAGSGPGFGGPGAPGSQSQNEVVGVGPLDLIDNMGGVIAGLSHELMFNVETAEPTYWQMATLSVFDGETWTPDPTTALVAGSGLQNNIGPVNSDLPILPTPQNQPTYSAQISLQGLGGPLLPVAPTTVSVSGSGTALIPGVGVIYSRGDRIPYGLSYSMAATRPVPQQSSSGSSLSAIPSSDLVPYLALPQVSGAVSRLAAQIVAGAATPVAKATALVKWFYSGAFHYTLSPPQVPGDPLSTFLFVTKAGFCQQFAGAYAVLARLDGLPTRLAVGFATGAPVAKNLRTKNASLKSYRVTGSDAHVWPEVYLGPQSGWVSFEPTPPSNSDPIGVGVVTGSGATTQTTLPGSSSASSVPPISSSRLPHLPASKASLPSSQPWSFWIVALVLIAAGAAGSIWLIVSRLPWLIEPWRRRRRERAARSAGPNALVLARFDSASWSLRRAGLNRLPYETLDEHTRRLAAQKLHETNRAFETYEELARLAERASYGADPCTTQDVADSRQLSETLRRQMREAGRFKPARRKVLETTRR